MSNAKIICAIVFARNNSSRLPGKVLMEIDGTTILGLCIRKLKQLPQLKIVVATSIEESDIPIVDWCKNNDVLYYTGDLNNVAERAANCINAYPCDAFFRVNADSPFLQTSIYEKAIEQIQNDGSLDLVTNVQERSFPYGIAVELIKTESFLSSVHQFTSVEQEHITKHFYDHADEYSIRNIKSDVDYSHIRLVLDTKDDWDQIKELYKNNNNIFNFNLTEIIHILKK